MLKAICWGIMAIISVLCASISKDILYTIFFLGFAIGCFFNIK